MIKCQQACNGSLNEAYHSSDLAIELKINIYVYIFVTEAESTIFNSDSETVLMVLPKIRYQIRNI